MNRKIRLSRVFVTLTASCALLAVGCSSPSPKSTSPTNNTTTTVTSTSASNTPGVSASTILIGAYGTKSTGALLNSEGLQQVSPGDTHAEIHAIVDYINAHGGVGGRRLDVVIHDQDVSAPDLAAENQAACTDFTEDHHVFAVVTTFSTFADSFAQCLQSHHTLLISDAASNSRDSTFFRTSSPYVWDPSGIALDRRASVYIKELSAAGFFDPGSKIGLVVGAAPLYGQTATAVLKPALSAKGLTVTKEISDPVADDQSGNQAPGAVLALKAAGVNHVLWWTDGAHASAYLAAMDQAKYYPREGFTSVNDPFVLELGSPPATLHGAVSVSYHPTTDTDRQHDPGTASEKLCLNLMNQAGVYLVDRIADLVATAYCDATFFLAAALNKAGPNPTAQSFATGAAALANTYQPSFGLATNFSSNRYDGESVVRILLFGDSCKCFTYSGPYIPTQ